MAEMDDPERRTPARTDAAPAVPVWPAFVAYGAVVVLTGFGGFVLLASAIAVRRLRDPALGRGREGLMLAVDRVIESPGLLIASSFLTDLVLVGVTLLAARGIGRAGPLRLQGLSPGPMAARGLAASVVGFIALSQVPDSVFGLIDWSPGGALEYLGRVIGAARGPTFALLVLAIGPAAGAAEELFFRGLMQPRLRLRWGPWPAVLVTAAAFGALHLDLVQSPLAFLAGIFLGWITERAGSLRPAIAAHAASNTASVLAAGALPQPWPRSVHALLLVLAVAVVIVCVRLVGAASPPTTRPPEGEAAPGAGSAP